MTNIKWVSAALIMFSTVVCQAQSKFEGVVKYNTTNTAVNEIATVAWYLKNGQSRLEFDTQAGENHLTYSLMMDNQEKEAFLTTGGASQYVSGIKADEKIAQAKFIRKTKVTENGYECEMLMFKSGDYELVYWMTNDVPITYEQLPHLVKNNMPKLTGISNGFPVKMEIRDAVGTIVQSQDVVSVTPTKVDDSKFVRK